MLRRRLSTLAIVAIFAACSFPQVSYETGSGGDGGGVDGTSGSSGGSSGEGGGHGDGASGDDAVAGDDATTDGSAGEGSAGEGGSDGSSGGDDSSSPSDAPYVFEAAADAPVCDQDEDTYNVKGGTCGGLDCDDTDKHANPGVTTFQTYAPHPPSNGDWNCDGTVTPQFLTGFNCGLLASSACAGKKGFTDTTLACGQTSANFITCKVSTALLCVVDTTTSNTQGCM